MFAEVLNREFVFQHVDLITKDLADAANEGGGSRRQSDPADPKSPVVSQEDIEAAAEAAREARDQMRATMGATLDGRAKNDNELTSDAQACFERNALISLTQTFLEEKLETMTAEAATPDAAATPADDGTATRHLKTTNMETREIQFSMGDIRWLSCKVAEGYRLYKKRHAFVPPPDRPQTIADDARVILVGDWGTGLPRAQKLARQIRKQLIEGQARKPHVIHLGDVYYSGWKDEYQKRVLAKGCWPVEPGEEDKFGSWCLNGNHDMYSGGHGYFDTLLGDRRFARQNGSSCFALQNSHWRILGLDTAYEDENLTSYEKVKGGPTVEQADWARDLTIQEPPRKVMLLSHHQIVSAYEEACEEVRKKAEKILATGHVRAWFWGHEHRHMHYEPKGGGQLDYPRCLGNGGVPVIMPRGATAALKKPATYEFRDTVKGATLKWLRFSFAVLDFNGGDISVTYIDEEGDIYKKETIS